MFPSPFKWFNHLAASFERAAHPLLVMQAQPSETPLFDATVLATGVNPEPYEMDDEHQYEHSAYVTNDMAIDLDCLALPLYSVEVSR